MSPASYAADANNHLMQVFGSNFQSGDTLTFTPPEGGTIASNSAKLTYVSATEIDYQFNDGTDPGTWSVRVNSPDGTQHSSYSAFSVAGAATNHPPTAQGHDQSAAPGTAIPLSSLFTYSDPDGASDLVKFDVRDRSPGGGYLVRDGQQQAAGTVYDVALSDISHWSFVAGPTGSIDTLGFNVVDQAGLFNPSVTAMVTSQAGQTPSVRPYLEGSHEVSLQSGASRALSSMVSSHDPSGSIAKYEIWDSIQGQGT